MKNCFECDGYETECRHYHRLNDRDDMCVYRKTADNDLEKYARGDKNLTLVNMLMLYLDKIGRKSNEK